MAIVYSLTLKIPGYIISFKNLFIFFYIIDTGCHSLVSSFFEHFCMLNIKAFYQLVNFYNHLFLNKYFPGLHTLRNENVHEVFNMHKYCVPMNFFPNGSDEMFVGRSGFLAACYMLNKRFGRTIVSDDTVLPLCNMIIESGKRTAQHFNNNNNNNPICPLMFTYYKTNYLGE